MRSNPCDLDQVQYDNLRSDNLICLQSFMDVYKTLRDDLMQDEVIGHPPDHAKEWFAEVDFEQHEILPMHSLGAIQTLCRSWTTMSLEEN